MVYLDLRNGWCTLKIDPLFHKLHSYPKLIYLYSIFIFLIYIFRNLSILISAIDILWKLILIFTNFLYTPQKIMPYLCLSWISLYFLDYILRNLSILISEIHITNCLSTPKLFIIFIYLESIIIILIYLLKMCLSWYWKLIIFF